MTQRETTLERYFQDRDTPMANRELIRSMMEQVGIERYEQLGSYLKAVRSSGGRDLQVHFGWTNGFTSEAEALAAIEGHAVAVWRSQRGWGVSHHVTGSGHEPGKDVRQFDAYGFCPKCFLSITATGACGCD